MALNSKSSGSSRNVVWRTVVDAYSTVNQNYGRLLAPLELTTSQFDVLLGIESLGDEASPKAIAEGLLVTMGNITSVTRRLIERGLIEQVANAKDKRSVYLRLTKSGVLLLKQAKAASKQFVQLQLGPFTQDEIEGVGVMMQRMRHHLESAEFQSSLERIISDQTIPNPTKGTPND